MAESDRFLSFQVLLNKEADYKLSSHSSFELTAHHLNISYKTDTHWLPICLLTCIYNQLVIDSNIK